MINDGINNVPEKTIAIFISPETQDDDLTKERVLGMMAPSEKKRDWFTPHFYRCLPLSIGNQYGFTISSEFDFCFEWNGGDQKEDITLEYEDKPGIYSPSIASHFGSGIITINTPFFIRTPPGVNIMTINPPNHIIPNVTPMTGVVETDNLRRNFTFNLKIQIPGIKVCVPAGTPIAGFIPIPRYYSDQFELKFADELFDQDIVDEEINADKTASEYRKTIEPTLKGGVSRHYMTGQDVYGNKFEDHQKS
jgi:hypothetical protein